MYASYIGHDTVVSLLIDAQCDVNTKNKRGQTPLMLAASCGNESVAFLLIQVWFAQHQTIDQITYRITYQTNE